ncbi:hypothetical protein [Streptomyces sp. NPDC057689]|uniref:hypothetical protein n=1 Tax=Streptomyces sp. NPDC057689 TaxID=3346213 RepID=UPI0036AE5177
MPAGPDTEPEGLFIPAERARRGGVYLAAILAGALGMVALELLIFFVVLVLIQGEGLGSMGWVGVGGYIGLPVFFAVVVLLPTSVLVWRQPGLRIDATGMTKVWDNRIQTVPWADIERAMFNSRRSLLLLRLKPGPDPRKPNGSGRRPIFTHSLGHAVWRRRRPGRDELIIEAVERFAPGTYTAEPWPVSIKGRAPGTGSPA